MAQSRDSLILDRADKLVDHKMADAPIGLLDLPNEILDDIVSRLHELKPLRNVSKSFASNWVICSRLFKVFTLWMHAGCWEILNSIANKPYLACHVKEIRVSSLPRLPVLGKKEWYCRGCSILSYARTLDEAHRDHHYSLYREWLSGESRLLDFPGKVGLHLELLPNFQRVEVVGYHQLASGILRFETRRERETLIEALDHVIYYGQPAFFGTHFTLFKRMLMASGANAKVRALSLGQLSELTAKETDLQLPVLENLEIDTCWAPGIKDLMQQRLAKISSICELSEATLPACFQFPASWLLSLNNLQTLNIRQGPKKSTYSEGLPDILTLLKGIYFPGLREVHMTRVAAMDEALGDFLSINLYNVKRLSIIQPEINETRWSQLKRKLESCRHYEYLELTDSLPLREEA